MMNITKAVMHLIIANVLFFILAVFVPVIQDKAALYYFENPEFHWWQLFSHLFMHGSIPHLFFNMFALYSFGAPLESYFGSNRFILFYFACGIGAGLLHMGVNYYEFHAGLDLLQSKAELMLMFLPIPIKAKYFIPILIALDLFSGVTGVSIFGSNIAHFAHVGGALIGFVLMKLWQKRSFDDRRLY